MTSRKLIVDYIILKLMNINIQELLDENDKQVFRDNKVLNISKVILKTDIIPTPGIQIATGRELREYQTQGFINCIFPVTLFINCVDTDLINSDSIFEGVNTIADAIEQELYNITAECNGTYDNYRFAVQQASLIYTKPSAFVTPESSKGALSELDIAVEYILNY